MTYYGQGLADLGSKIERGLTAIAKAMEKAQEKQGSPITYNITVTTPGDATPEQVAERVTEAMKRREGR